MQPVSKARGQTHQIEDRFLCAPAGVGLSRPAGAVRCSPSWCYRSHSCDLLSLARWPRLAVPHHSCRARCGLVALPRRNKTWVRGRMARRAAATDAPSTATKTGSRIAPRPARTPHHHQASHDAHPLANLTRGLSCSGEREATRRSAAPKRPLFGGIFRTHVEASGSP